VDSLLAIQLVTQTFTKSLTCRLTKKVLLIQWLTRALAWPNSAGTLAAIEEASNRKHDALTGSRGLLPTGARCLEWFELRVAYAAACGLLDMKFSW
jgi:hypothetical protein